jgi:2-oxoglutarate ferredoxin oxidoreductase subunit beta
MSTEAVKKVHPNEKMLRAERLPSEWCSGCGIGIVVYSFIDALQEMRQDQDRVVLLTGSGCTGRVADYLQIRSRRATKKYLIDEAADVALSDPDSLPVVFMDNADLLVSGAEDLQRAIKRNARVLVIHINNIIYILKKDGPRANTPFTRPAPDGSLELPFNMPGLLMSYGASFVARWTPLQAGWLKYSIAEALQKNGFRFIEIVSPCLVYEADQSRIGDAMKKISLFDRQSVRKIDTDVPQFDIRNSGRIVIGKILDRSER